MQERKIMIVTVGTSLFNSASWDFDKVDCPRYNLWKDKMNGFGEPGPLISPEARMTNPKGREIKNYFETKLTLNNTSEWTKRFEVNIKKSEVMRYSAEFSTLFGLRSNKDPKVSNDFTEFEKIHFVYDPDNYKQKNLQHIAAVHLQAYFKKMFPDTNPDSILISGLSSRNPKILLPALEIFLKNISQISQTCHELFVIAAGGYKIYSILVGILSQANSNINIVYRHEEGDKLVIVNRKKIQFPEVGESRKIDGIIETHQGP
ncbi:MAG: hypothetical protein JXB26_02270 [Candidatus Aminicenantes bacterium]|nr:hypothetical protein [Candidatus Aminicenantes bacterium]